MSTADCPHAALLQEAATHNFTRTAIAADSSLMGPAAAHSDHVHAHTCFNPVRHLERLLAERGQQRRQPCQLGHRLGAPPVGRALRPVETVPARQSACLMPTPLLQPCAQVAALAMSWPMAHCQFRQAACSPAGYPVTVRQCTSYCRPVRNQGSTPTLTQPCLMTCHCSSSHTAA